MACVPPEELVGFGAMLQYQDPLTDEWVTIGGTNDLEFPEDTTEAIDTTANDSDGGYETNIPSPLSKLEPVEYEFNFRWSQWQFLVNMKANKVIYDWRIVLMNPEQTYMQFCAWISKLGGAIPMRELVKASTELTPTGRPTWGQLI